MSGKSRLVKYYVYIYIHTIWPEYMPCTSLYEKKHVKYSMLRGLDIRGLSKPWFTAGKFHLTIWVFPKIGVPQNHPFNSVFHYKPSILGHPYFWKYPHSNIFFYQARSPFLNLHGIHCKTLVRHYVYRQDPNHT